MITSLEISHKILSENIKIINKLPMNYLTYLKFYPYPKINYKSMLSIFIDLILKSLNKNSVEE